ncbi:MAG TPA: hypothetical protein VIL74_07215 [Pyrinomonadaceae bacterium]|jgi:hypothetical protein
MERIYRYEALESMNANHHKLDDNALTRPLQTPYLNEAVNFVKDSNGAMIRVIRNDPNGEKSNVEQKILLPYQDIKDLSQKEILEEIEKRFREEYE